MGGVLILKTKFLKSGTDIRISTAYCLLLLSVRKDENLKIRLFRRELRLRRKLKHCGD